MTVHHARISPTAKLAAFLRAESGIPYCRQIADMCDAEEVSRTFDAGLDRKSTRLNSSHLGISYAVFCLKKKKTIATSCNLLASPVARSVYGTRDDTLEA